MLQTHVHPDGDFQKFCSASSSAMFGMSQTCLLLLSDALKCFDGKVHT